MTTAAASNGTRSRAERSRQRARGPARVIAASSPRDVVDRLELGTSISSRRSEARARWMASATRPAKSCEQVGLAARERLDLQAVRHQDAGHHVAGLHGDGQQRPDLHLAAVIGQRPEQPLEVRGIEGLAALHHEREGIGAQGQAAVRDHRRTAPPMRAGRPRRARGPPRNRAPRGRTGSRVPPPSVWSAPACSSTARSIWRATRPAPETSRSVSAAGVTRASAPGSTSSSRPMSWRSRARSASAVARRRFSPVSARLTARTRSP